MTSYRVTEQGNSEKKVQPTMELDCGSEERQLLVDRSVIKIVKQLLFF